MERIIIVWHKHCHGTTVVPQSWHLQLLPWKPPGKYGNIPAHDSDLGHCSTVSTTCEANARGESHRAARSSSYLHMWTDSRCTYSEQASFPHRHLCIKHFRLQLFLFFWSIFPSHICYSWQLAFVQLLQLNTSRSWRRPIPTESWLQMLLSAIYCTQTHNTK